MALDGIILNKVKEDLEGKLPIRINRISQTSKTEIVFNVHAAGIRTNLVVSLHSVYNHICLSEENFTTYAEPGTFVMVLRKYVLNGIIYAIDQADYDRYLILHVRARNELYDEKEYLISVELMGKYANLILVDKETGKIIDALKKIPPYENTTRTILSGALFTYPQPQHKKDPFTSTDINFDNSLVAECAGFSKILENEVRYRMHTQSFSSIMEEIKNSHHLYISEKGENKEYHLIPLLSLDCPYEKWDLNKGFDKLYFQSDEKERIKNVSDDIFKFVRRQLKHYDTRKQKLLISLQEARNLQSDKMNGDLLYTYSDLDQKGLKEITVEDYDGNQTTIRLDPKLSVKDNANKYYQAYQKKRKGQSYIEEQIEITDRSLEYFSAISEQLTIANYQDALDIKDELQKLGYLKKGNFKEKKKKKITLYQIAVDDCLITFGKNNIQNDYLSFDVAKGNWMWFHAKDYHGSHVVVNTDEPSEKVLRICANIAAYNSKGRFSSSVPVNYCLAKNLKKVKGMPRGFVSIRNYKTIYIDPVEDRSLTVRSV